MIETATGRMNWPIDDGHIADPRGYCRRCTERMPCDVSCLTSDYHEALDEIDALHIRIPMERLLAVLRYEQEREEHGPVGALLITESKGDATE